MSSTRPSSLGLPRFLLLALASAGLGVLLFWYFEQPARQPIKLLTQPAHQVPSLSEQIGVGTVQSGFASTHGLTSKEAPPQVTTPSAGLESRPPPPRSFKFLGKVTQDGKTVVLLHCCGRILTVSGTGPIGDGYVVVDIQEDHLVLQHEQLGESHILQLTQQRQARFPVGSPDDTPQD